MPEVALGLFVAFLLTGFGWRTWLQYRLTGDHGFRGFSGGSVERLGGLLFAASVALALAGPVAEIAGLVTPLRTPNQGLFNLGGVALGLAGSAIAVTAQIQMGASWRVGVREGERTQLVNTGLFARVRNPIFTGMMLALAGLVLLPNVISALALLCAVAGIEIQVRFVEEPHLIRVHGDGYLSYARTVGRFVPGWGRLP